MDKFKFLISCTGIYETLKISYLEYSQGEYNEDGSQKQPNIFVLWSCGMISGTIGATSVYPLNVIRTRYKNLYFHCKKTNVHFLDYKHKARQDTLEFINLHGRQLK